MTQKAAAPKKETARITLPPEHEQRFAVQELVDQLMGRNPEHRFNFIQNNAAARQQIQAPIFEDKVVDHIFAAAQVEEKEVSKEELQTAVEALDEE